jgi:hypothetical protein
MKMFALLLLFFLSPGCSPVLIPDRTATPSAVQDLPSTVGDVSTVRRPQYELAQNVNEDLTEKTEYAERTNKWFKTGFAISAGTMLPGEEAFVRLDRAVRDSLKYRYRLTERNAALDVVSLVKEDTTTNNEFRVMLPQKEGALYLFSVEALNDRGEVEDTLLSLIEVPEQQLNARLYTDNESYHANEKVTLHLENFGPTALFFGLDYALEVYEGGAWRALRFDNVAVPALGISLSPGETYDQTLALAEKLPPGLYRAVKRFNADGTELEATLAAPFLIVE